jgi:rubrerythrin
MALDPERMIQDRSSVSTISDFVKKNVIGKLNQTAECPKCHTMKFRLIRQDLRDQEGRAVAKWRCGRCGYEMVTNIAS